MAGRSVATKDSPTRTVEYVAEIARLYRDDYTGYCQDILGFSPYEWQSQLGRDLLTKKRNGIASGHGIGKTRCAASLIHWFISTRPRPAIVATANTEDQLQKKLWRELAVVNNGAKNRDWFTWKTSTFTMFEDPTAQA